jgi:predicted amidohydrolase YtcJ
MKILHNVAAYKMDETFGTASAIAWDNDRIVAIGDEEDLFRDYGEAERIDGNGRAVLPGFIDPHIHFVLGLLYQGALDCTSEQAPTIEALKDLLRKSSENVPEGQWVVGQGYDPGRFPDRKGPTRHDLDDACPDSPVMLMHFSCHECVANSKALALAGIDRDTPQPFAGEIEKDSDGNPTGHLVERGMNAVEALARKSLIAHTGDTLLGKLPGAEQELFSYGVTRIADPAAAPDYEAIYRRAVENDLLKMPIVIYPSSDKGLLDLPWDRLEDEPTGSGDDRLRVGPLKIFLDGGDRLGVVMSPMQFAKVFLGTIARSIGSLSLDSFKAAARIPLRRGKDGKFHGGIMMAPPEELRKLVSEAVDKGFTLALHAVGNEAIDQAIDTISHVRDRHKDYPPPRIEHGILMEDQLIRRMADLRIALVTQPYWMTLLHSDKVPRLPGIKLLPLRSLIDAGVRVSGSSDWPVSSNQPLLAIERAVTRITEGDERLDVHETITAREAIAMYTSEAAYVLGCSDDVGSLEVGKRADFIMLSEDPFNITEDQWKSLNIQKTYLGGELVFSRS